MNKKDLVNNLTYTKARNTSQNCTHFCVAIHTLLRGINAADKNSVQLHFKHLHFKVFSRYFATFKKTVRPKKKKTEQIEEVKMCLHVPLFGAKYTALLS